MNYPNFIARPLHPELDVPVKHVGQLTEYHAPEGVKWRLNMYDHLKASELLHNTLGYAAGCYFRNHPREALEKLNGFRRLAVPLWKGVCEHRSGRLILPCLVEMNPVVFTILWHPLQVNDEMHWPFILAPIQSPPLPRPPDQTALTFTLLEQ